MQFNTHILIMVQSKQLVIQIQVQVLPVQLLIKAIIPVPYVPVIQVGLVIPLSILLLFQILIKVFIPVLVPNVPGIQVQIPLFAIFLVLVIVIGRNGTPSATTCGG